MWRNSSASIQMEVSIEVRGDKRCDGRDHRSHESVTSLDTSLAGFPHTSRVKQST
jgi:hypothetical protein